MQNLELQQNKKKVPSDNSCSGDEESSNGNPYLNQYDSKPTNKPERIRPKPYNHSEESENFEQKVKDLDKIIEQ